MYGVETDPVKSNNGNVTIRYVSVDEVHELPELKYTNINGEDGEVESVKWINIRDITGVDRWFALLRRVVEGLPEK